MQRDRPHCLDLVRLAPCEQSKLSLLFLLQENKRMMSVMKWQTMSRGSLTHPRPLAAFEAPRRAWTERPDPALPVSATYFSPLSLGKLFTYVCVRRLSENDVSGQL